MSTYEILVDGKLKRVEISRIREKVFMVKVDGENFTVEVPMGKPANNKEFEVKIGDKAYAALLHEVSKTKPFTVKVGEASFKVELKKPALGERVAPTTEQAIQAFSVKTVKPKQVVSGTVTAPMTGKIVSIKVRRGERVKAGQVLCILEAMKMENEITAPVAGTVREILVSEGASVNEGDPLFVVS